MDDEHYCKLHEYQDLNRGESGYKMTIVGDPEKSGTFAKAAKADLEKDKKECNLAQFIEGAYV